MNNIYKYSINLYTYMLKYKTGCNVTNKAMTKLKEFKINYKRKIFVLGHI